MVAQRLAAVAPRRVASVILCDTASVIGPPQIWDDRIAAVRAGGMAAIVDGVLGRWFTPAFRKDNPVVTRGFALMLERTPVEGYAGCSGAIRDADLRADAARIACPALVIVGDQDVATPPAAAEALARSIDGASCAVIEGAAHIPIAERPEEVNGLIAEHMANAAMGKAPR
jgi:3-oxoadipate enol-lactonase